MKNKDISKYNETMLSLARHWGWADKMKEQFEVALKKNGIPEINIQWYLSDVFIFMALWYAILFEVLKTLDKKNIKPYASFETDKDKIFNALRDFRSAVFHIEGKYNSEKFYKIMQDENSVKKIHEVHKKVGHFLIKYILEIPL